MLANVVLPGIASAATPDAELQGAYEWAHDKGVTTMSTFEAANMYGAITRAEMAKMLSVYAVESLGYKADSSKACAFSDIASVKGDLHDYIIESCQLGVMGQGITAFRPYDTISRAEFGTALSRVLWGNKYEGGNPYYANHLNALKSAGIMNQITNAESTKEVRGYVMLMLQRSDEGNSSSEDKTSTDCDDAAIALACKLGSDLCPAKCKAAEDEEDEVVKSGDLSITARAADGKKVLADDATSDLDTLTFKTSENVEITKITLEKWWYSTASEVIEKVWLEDGDGNEITTPKEWSTTNSKDQITLSVKKDYRNLDGSMIATIVLQTKSGTGYVGGTIGFKVVSVESTAENVSLDLKNYTPYEYDLANYKWGNISLDNIWTDGKNYNYAAGESYEIVKFKVTAGEAPVIMKQFKLVKDAGLAISNAVDMYDDLDDLEVLVDGSTIKARYSVDKSTKDITVSFDEIELAAKKWATFTVNASFAEDFEGYNKYVKYGILTGGFVATEKKTGARVSHDEMAAVSHQFRGGQVKFTNKSLGTIDAAAGATDVVFAEWTVEVPELITLNSFVITGISTISGDYIEAMRLVIAGEEYEGTPTRNGVNAVFTFNWVEFEKSGKVQFKLDLAKGAEWSVTFQPGSFDKAIFSGALYDDSREAVNTGDVKWYITLTKVNVRTAQATMDKKADSDDTVEFIKEEPATKVIYEGTYTTRKGDVKLNKFWLTGATQPDNNEVTYHVYINNEEVGSTDQYGSETKYEEFSDILVKDGKSVSVKVEVYCSAENEASYSGLSLYLEWVDTSEDENASGRGEATLNAFEVKAKGSVTIPNTAANDTAYLKKSEVVVAEFIVKPSNGSEGVKFDDILLTGAQFSSGAFRVKVDGIEKFDPEIATGANWATWFKYTVDETLPVEGSKVTVIAKNAMTGAVSVNVLEVNGKTMNKTNSKFFVESLITFTSQEEGSISTVYTVNVKSFKDTYSVTGFTLYYGGDCQTTKVEGVPASLTEGSNEFTVYQTGAIQAICGMSYTVLDADGHDLQVIAAWEIKKDPYKDLFKVGGKEIAVPKLPS